MNKVVAINIEELISAGFKGPVDYIIFCQEYEYLSLYCELADVKGYLEDLVEDDDEDTVQLVEEFKQLVELLEREKIEALLF